MLCPIKSSKCLAFLNPDGRRGDLISEILGPSLISRRLTDCSARGTGALSAPSSYASFLIVPSSDPLSSLTLVPSIRRKYEASFSKYQKAPSEFLRRVIGTPRRHEPRVGLFLAFLAASSFPTFSILFVRSQAARTRASDNVKGRL